MKESYEDKADRKYQEWKEEVTSIHGYIQIPVNHNVTGTCGCCGWPIISPVVQSGDTPPLEWCMNCGRHPKPAIATFGPVREMV